MEKQLENIVQNIQQTFNAVVNEFRGEIQLLVEPGQIVKVLATLREQYSFELLSALTAVDYYPQTSPRFHVVYQLTSVSKNLSLQVRVPLDEDNPRLPTSTDVYAVANWRERELLDMFGLVFEGHPDPRRILTPEGTEGHPLRRDFPLGYEEPQFTFNYDQIAMRKPHPKE